MTTRSDPETVVIRGISFPKRLDEFVRGKIIDNEPKAPGLGVTVPYHGGIWGEATIYVYDLGIMGIPSDPLSPEVRWEFDRTTKEMAQAMQQYGAFDLLGRWVLGAHQGRPSFLSAGFVVEDSKGLQHSYLFLTGAKRCFLKIRLTCKAGEHSSKVAGALALSLASTLQSDADNIH